MIGWVFTVRMSSSVAKWCNAYFATGRKHHFFAPDRRDSNAYDNSTGRYRIKRGHSTLLYRKLAYCDSPQEGWPIPRLENREGFW